MGNACAKACSTPSGFLRCTKEKLSKVTARTKASSGTPVFSFRKARALVRVISGKAS